MNASLKFLGRQHSVAEALRALETAKAHFPRVTFDLIYARAGQSLDAWKRELSQALDFDTEHLSLYQLTIEPGTPFAERFAAGGLTVLDEDATADLFALTQELTAAAGRPAYEISNHARPGAESRHNLIYWRYRDYAGIGPGAHGRVTTEGELRATAEKRSPEAWLQAIESQGTALSEDLAVSREDRATEALMMGLRLKEGLDLAAFEARTGRSLAQTVDQRALDWLKDDGLIAEEAGRLRLTQKGWPLLNSVTGSLLS